MAAGKESLAIRPDLGKLPGMTAKQKKLSPLDQALACQRDGDLEGAEAGFRAVLEADSEQPDALVLLGILLRKTGRANEAIPFIERAIAAAQRQGSQSAAGMARRAGICEAGFRRSGSGVGYLRDFIEGGARSARAAVPARRNVAATGTA